MLDGGNFRNIPIKEYHFWEIRKIHGRFFLFLFFFIVYSSACEVYTELPQETEERNSATRLPQEKPLSALCICLAVPALSLRGLLTKTWGPGGSSCVQAPGGLSREEKATASSRPYSSFSSPPDLTLLSSQKGDQASQTYHFASHGKQNSFHC